MNLIDKALRRVLKSFGAPAAGAAAIEDSTFDRGELTRLRAVVNGLAEGVVSVDSALGQASVNVAAAKLLDLPPGKVPASDFAAAMARLSGRSLNHGEIREANRRARDDPGHFSEQVWRFATNPTYLRVTSTPVREPGFAGRVWVFADESALSQALDVSEYTRSVIQTASDAMLDPLVQVVAIRDDAGRIVDFVYRDVNRATCNYLGTSREALIGATLRQTFPNIAGSGLLEHYIGCATTGEPLILDDFCYDDEVPGAARRYDIRGARVWADVLTLTWRDVTDRFESAARIAGSEERFRLLAENVGDVVCRTREGRVVWISNSVDEMLGAPPGHWVGRHAGELISGEGIEGFDRVTRISKGYTYVGRAVVRGADGTPHWVHLNAKPFVDADGTIDGAVSSFRLIDNEVAAERQVEAARELQAQADARYRRLMDNSAVGMGLVTPDGRFDAVNQAMCDFFGYDADTLCSKTWQQLTVKDHLADNQRNLDAMIAGQLDSYRTTKQYIRSDGRLVWGNLTVSCIRGADGRLENFSAQIIDVTAEADARQRNDELAARLQTQTDRLTAELDSAAAYVESLLPGALDGPVRVSSEYLPSQELAGDCYDYAWVDDDHLTFYILDVSGHGVAPALLSISVYNLLRSGSLPRDVVLAPERVLATINHNFPMDRQGGHYFTMWYGVYEKSTRTLRYASGGHPAALLFSAEGDTPAQLSTGGLPVGMFDDDDFLAGSVVVPPGSRLLLYSDGAYEWTTTCGRPWSWAEFIGVCTDHAQTPDWKLDVLVDTLRGQASNEVFEDDCSLVGLTFF
jgi:PAS domain S-box-containing protein